MNIKTLKEISMKFKAATGSINLDLGCGLYAPDGYIGIDNYIGIDIQKGEKLPDYIHDLNETIPLEDGVVDSVVTSHFLEHAHLDFIIPEVARLLKKGGRFKNAIPYAFSAEVHYPGHNLFLTEKWSLESPMVAQSFEVEDVSYLESDEYKNLPKNVKDQFPFEFARTFLCQSCKEFTITLKRK